MALQALAIVDASRRARARGMGAAKPMLSPVDVDDNTARTVELPLDLWACVFEHCSWIDRLRCRALNRSFETLCGSGHLYRTIELARLGSWGVPAAVVRDILPAVISFTLLPHAITSERHVGALFAEPWPRLVHLDLSFCRAVSDAVLELLGNATLARLRSLVCRGCRNVTDGAWLAYRLLRVERVDLAWSGVASLPGLPEVGKSVGDPFDDAAMDVDMRSDDSAIALLDEDRVAASNTTPWPCLRSLDLRACHHLHPLDLAEFLTTPATFPRQLQRLDLAWLSPATLDAIALRDLVVTRPDDGEPNELAVLDVRNCDGVTLAAVAELRRGAGERRRGSGPELRILHNALLTSDDTEGYRRFVAMVSQAIVL